MLSIGGMQPSIDCLQAQGKNRLRQVFAAGSCAAGGLQHFATGGWCAANGGLM